MERVSLTASAGAVVAPDDDLRCEVELAPMGAHEAWMTTVLAFVLGTFVRQHHLGWVVQEMLFDFTAFVQRKRRLDVAFVSYERWPRHTPVPDADAWDVVPSLVVEVVSPSDKGRDILDKVAEYFRVGVTSVWLLYPSQQQLYAYDALHRCACLRRQMSSTRCQYCHNCGSPWPRCSRTWRRRSKAPQHPGPSIRGAGFSW